MTILRFLAFAFLLCLCASAQTTVTGTMVTGTNDRVSGSCDIQSSGTFTAATGSRVVQPRVTVTFTNGSLSVALLPTDTASPTGVYYLVSCNSPQQTVNGRRLQPYTWPTKIWIVPTSATALDVSLVETTSPPTTIVSSIGTTSVDGVNGITTPALRLNPASLAKPTCVVGLRGEFWVTSSASGTQDLVETCTKQADDSYAWASSIIEPTSTAVLGDLPYRTATGWSRLAGNTLASKRLLCQTGTGSVSAAPTWCALVAGDIPDISATYSTKTAGGDLSGTLPSPTVAKVNGTSVPVNSAADQVLGTTASATGSWISVANCVSTGGVLQYATASHTFSCHTLATSDVPDLSATYSTKTAGGDLSGTLPSPTVAKLNGTSVPTNSAADQFLGTSASATAAWVSVANCVSTGGVLNYATSTHTFSCHTLVSADIPNNAANTTGNALTATTATNLAAGTTGQFPYQTGAGATGFRTPNAANGPVVLDSSGNATVSATVSAGNVGGSTWYFRAPIAPYSFNGATCDGSTDDTTAFNALLTTIYNAGGGTVYVLGTCLISGAVVVPNDGGSPPKQVFLRITGAGSSANGYWSTMPTSPSVLDLRFNASVAKLDTRGAGLLEIDHLTLKDGGSDCAAYIQTTNTTVMIHDVAFTGTASGTSACNDAVVMGGTTTTINGLSTGAFQGYGTRIWNNYFDKMRRGAYSRVYGNAITVDHNTWSSSSGSNLTTAITAATNATPTVLTITGHGMSVGTTYSLFISGGTGSWAGINGARVATPIDANTVSIPVDATAFGALAGSPVFGSGAAIELDGTGDTASGNNVESNLVEMVNYPLFLKCTKCVQSNITSNNLYDANTKSVMYYSFNTTSQFNRVEHGFGNDTTALWGADATSTENSVMSAHQSLPTTWAEPWRFTNSGIPVQVRGGGRAYDILNTATNDETYWALTNTSSNVFLGTYLFPAGGAVQNLMVLERFSGGATVDLNLGDASTTTSASRFRAPGGDLKLMTANSGNVIWLCAGTGGCVAYMDGSGTLHSLGVMWTATGAHFAFANGLTQNDTSGVITVSASTTGTKTFGTAWNSTPTCSLTPTGDPTAVGVYWATATTSVLTANVKTSGTLSFNYHCIGNPN